MNNYEETIDLKHLLYTICRGWKKMIVWAVIVALLASAFAAYQYMNPKTLENENKNTEKKILQLKTELTPQELDEVYMAVNMADSYLTQRNNTLDYLANAYSLQNKDGFIPSNTYRFVVGTQNQAQYTYTYVADPLHIISLQLRFRIVDPEGREDGMQVRHNLTNIINSTANALNSMDIAKHVLDLCGLQIDDKRISTYFNAEANEDAGVVVTLSYLSLTQEQKSAVIAYLQDYIVEYLRNAEKTFGTYQASYEGTIESASSVDTEKMEQLAIEAAAKLQIPYLAERMESIVSIPEQRKAADCLTVSAEGSYLKITLNNLMLNNEQAENLEAVFLSAITQTVESDENLKLWIEVCFVNRKDTTVRADSRMGSAALLSSELEGVNLKHEIATILNADEKYMQDVVNITVEGDVVSVVVKHIDLNDEQASRIEEKLKSMIDEVTTENSDLWEGTTVNFIGHSYLAEANTNGSNNRTTYLNTVNSLNTSLRTIPNNMSGNQKSLYNLMLEDKLGTDDSKQEIVDAQLAANHFSLKFPVIGFILGVLLAVGLIVIRYLSNGKIHTLGDVEGQELNVLGRMRCTSYTGIDRSIHKCFYGREDNIDNEAEIQLITSRLAAFASSNGFKSVFISGTSGDKKSFELQMKLRDALTAKFDTVLNTENLNKDSDAAEELTHADFVVLVQRLEYTDPRDVAKSKEICKMCKKEIAGTVVVF